MELCDCLRTIYGFEFWYFYILWMKLLLNFNCKFSVCFFFSHQNQIFFLVLYAYWYLAYALHWAHLDILLSCSFVYKLCQALFFFVSFYFFDVIVVFLANVWSFELVHLRLPTSELSFSPMLFCMHVLCLYKGKPGELISVAGWKNFCFWDCGYNS